MKKRTILLTLIILLSFTVFGQVTLQWKLKKGDTLRYKTYMNDLDTSANTFSFSFHKLMSLFGDTLHFNDNDINGFYKQFLHEFSKMTMLSELTESKPGIIDIVASLENKPTTTQDTSGSKQKNVDDLLKNLATTMNKNRNKTDTIKDTNVANSKNIDDMLKVMQKMMPNVLLRGAVYERGGVESFYVKSDQRNLIAMLFELPKGKLKKNDVWSLDVHFLSMDNNFTCDTSFHKNKVKLVDIKKQNGETIAVLNYDIAEYVSGDFTSPFMGNAVKTTMKMTFTCIAEFSVDKGRWISYNGIMSLIATGALNSNMIKAVSLVQQ